MNLKGDFFMNKKRSTKYHVTRLVFAAMAIAIAMVCSMIKLVEMPMGGSVTMLSMVFISLIGYWYGPSTGIMTAMAYGLVQFILEPFFYTIPQMLLDYPLAFGCLGITGIFHKKKHGLVIGYIVGVCGRFACTVLSGVIFFAEYAPDGMHPVLYSVLYNGSYLLPEAIVTLIVISIPKFSQALAHVKRQAIEQM